MLILKFLDIFLSAQIVSYLHNYKFTGPSGRHMSTGYKPSNLHRNQIHTSLNTFKYVLIWNHGFYPLPVLYFNKI